MRTNRVVIDSALNEIDRLESVSFRRDLEIERLENLVDGLNTEINILKAMLADAGIDISTKGAEHGKSEETD